MISFFLSLAAMFLAPTGISVPPEPAAAAAAPVERASASTPHPGFDWLGGTWKFNGLEMTCAVKGQDMACDEVGKSGPMQGAAAKLTFWPGNAKIAARLTLALPNIPATTFNEVSNEPQSATFETKTPNGVARLRFTRIGDELKVERASGDKWGQAMVYKRG